MVPRGDKKNPHNIWSSKPEESVEDFAVAVESGQRYRFCMQSNSVPEKDAEDDSTGNNFEIQEGFDLRVQMLARALPDDDQRCLESAAGILEELLRPARRS